jgi:RNA ligase (TIGR02306 family)
VSTHSVDVIRIDAIEPHPNADQLGLVRVGGYTVCVRKADWKVGDLAAYIEPDYVVPERPEYAFLGAREKDRRVKVKRLRGVMSMGLLMPAPEGSREGDNVMELLGITRYEPPIEPPRGQCTMTGTSAWSEAPHASLGHLPKYDLENWRKVRRVLVTGERVFVTEKIHGANARFAFRDGRMWCGSRNEWKAEGDNAWWNALRSSPWVEEYCRENPTHVVYGEAFGWVADLRYGHQPGEVSFRVFDVMTPNGWMGFYDLTLAFHPKYRVPLLYIGHYTDAVVEELADFDSHIPGANHLAEGVVIKPMEERYDPRFGRVALKLVSNRYLERQ